jgi:signal transduction histidine kinase/ActR/RegA family two-component response regulator
MMPMDRLHVLLLEANPLDTELTLASLAEGGFDCKALRASTRDEFVSALAADAPGRDGPFDLILADHPLPSFDGVSALRIARESSPETPFLFVCGEHADESAAEAIENGAAGCVPKRRLSALAPSVRRVLREARDRRELRRAQSELRRSEERCRLLEGAREAAEGANRLKDEFLATVSHELRTPLTAMLGWARMLRGADVDRATLEEGLETIERNANAQAQLIEDLLDLSRIVTGKLRLTVRPTEIVPVVHEAIDSVRLAADSKGIRLRLIHEALGQGGGLVNGDPDRLQQVVWNLLTNAIKFTPRGGAVSVRIDRVGSGVRLSVSDTGRGIGPSFLPHVFDRFRQADASSTRRHGGLGLGLSICRHLVELHGGTIDARSDGEAKGATFTVMLPLMPPASDKVHPRRGRHAGGLDAPHGTNGNNERGFESWPVLAGLRVLVVDDEPDARRLLSAVLERCKAQVHVAASAAEAMAAMDAHRPDVLLSDIGMPGEDGYSLIARVRQLPPDRGGSIPAAALTAFARAEDRRRVLAAGFQAYLSKPVEPEALVSAVARLAGRAVGDPRE